MAKKESKSAFERELEKMMAIKGNLESRLSGYAQMSNPDPGMIEQLQTRIFEIEHEMFIFYEQETARNWNNEPFVIGEYVPKPEVDIDEKEQRRRVRRQRRRPD